jgi:hypothetical protein
MFIVVRIFFEGAKSIIKVARIYFDVAKSINEDARILIGNINISQDNK